MSFSGIKQFDENLRNMMDSETFKEADRVQQLNLGGLLLQSKYGLGCGFGFLSPKELKLKSSLLNKDNTKK